MDFLKSSYAFAIFALLSGSLTTSLADSASMQEIAIPYYAKGQGSPAAVVRIKKVYTDHQRRGFFRIGLLPVLVAEDVKIEIIQPQETLAALQQARRWLKPTATQKALEWRRVQFFFPAETEPRLEAAKIHLSEAGAWRLTGGVVLRHGTNQTRQAEATLQVTGPQAGELLATHQGGQRLNLLQTSFIKD